MPSPSPQHDAHGPRLLGGELQAPRGGHRQTDKLADHGGKSAEGQALLHRRQRLLFPIAFAKDHTVRMEPGLGDGREKQVGARHAPQNLATGSGGDAGNEQRRSSAIDRPSPAAGDLVQRPEGEPSSRQSPINLGDTERQDLPCALRAAFKPLDALAKLCQHGVEGMVGHGRIVAPSGFSAVL